MTRIEVCSKQAISRLNKILRLTQEVMNLQEEIALIQNSKDFSKAVLIDAKGVAQPGYIEKLGKIRPAESETTRHRALFGPLSHTVKKLHRAKKEPS